MRSIRRQTQNKIYSKKGMTIGELLVTLLIVTLLTTGIASGMRFALTQYDRTYKNADAIVLGSTLESVIKNELSKTSEIIVNESGKVLKYRSPSLGIYMELCTANTKVIEGVKSIVPTSEDGYGELMLKEELYDGNYTYHPLLGSKAYSSYNLGVRANVIYDSVHKVYDVTLEIADKDGTPLNTGSRSFKVIPLQRPKVD